MYLKKITLFGFKSFANKTELVFEPGVTAVVGPNGCGKSNISDGIKWVLGEQSAKELRGSKMEDIIFNGTADTQAVNLAEVSLTLSNKDRILPVDYDEVIVTRRTFRSGESEYLLNKTQVRLKDIMNILAGTGIGVSSYSVAEQGKMDRVLNAKPEDRREIFEEASGITKYKTQKKEALNKLEHTETNLTRLADIINEVKRQINSIERQAKKAEKFRAEFENLKEKDIRLSFHDYSQVKDQETGTKQKTDSLKQKEGHFSLELNVQQDELRIHRDKITSIDETIAETRQNLSEISSTIDKNDNSVRIDRERIDELSKRSDSLQREIGEIGVRLTQLRDKIGSVESEFNVIDHERENKQVLLSEAERALNSITETIKQCEKAISDSKLAIMDNATSQSRVKTDLSKISASLTTASSRHRRLTIEKDNISKEKLSIDSSFQAAEESLTQQKRALDSVLNQLNSAKSVFSQLKTNTEEKASAIETLKQRLASAGSKLEVLKDLKEKKEGFSEGVKAYMEFIENNPEEKELFVGTIAGLVRPKEGFIAAIESALGERSQMIVVKDKEAVDRAIDFLKREEKGRAQFIALDEILDTDIRLEQPAHPSLISNLIDCIDTEDTHKPVLEYILQDTYLVESIADTGKVAKGSAALFVTKVGETSQGLVTTGGSSSGDEYTSIIGRDAKIRELSQEVKTLKTEVSHYEDEYLQMLQRKEQMQKEVTGLESVTKAEEMKLHTRESERVKTAEQRDKLEQELGIIGIELDEITEEEKILHGREETLTPELANLEQEHAKLDSVTNQSQATISEKTQEKETTIAKLAEIRTQMSLVTEKFNAQSDTLNMMKGSLSNEETAISDRKNQLEEAHDKLAALRSEIERLIEENKVLENQKQIVSQKLDTARDERKAISSLVEGAESTIRGKQKELDEIRSNISTFHINVNELNHKADNIRERIFNAYKVDLDEENITSSDDEDWDAIALEVEQLKEKIERMGPVNLVAIEEHKELQDRYEFLTSQQEDLLNAKESLHKAINKINRTTRKMFIETFEQINVAFKEYFKLLFGGGTAELFLLDQADILESGIEIVVRPPGKKLQSISLLSGGEKALTSIALLFSLFKVRPTPFCILDEIDAPLDEANIDRFSRILQEFVKTTQFIIITHNKKTISVSDIMYGITMEKSGISKIVSVKFAEDDKKSVTAEQRDAAKPDKAKPDLKSIAQQANQPKDPVVDHEK
ncbi:MAG: chromosome segregation protein SMC [Candidatus Omnitrophica bacterium]|nr:chromosome segregation protein SMC [Candidatus Omnitrophota bacterium]